ncbi:hypothetical protein ACHAPJ_012956 [Fusarium lateritium]
MDFSMGPLSGQGVPAHPDEPGLAYNLEYYNISLSAGKTWTGTLPEWGRGELVSAQTFAVTNTTKKSTYISKFALLGEQAGSVDGKQYTLASSSLADVSDLIQSNGSITVTAPVADGASSYFLMASYYSRSYERACIPSNNDPQNILQNGSFAVDHFSPVGAQLTTRFLQEHILTDGIDELMREVGNYVWEDSVEIPGVVYWTPGLVEAFRGDHGYSIEKYVPLLSGRNGFMAQTSGIGSVFFILDDEDRGAGIVSDWRETMTRLSRTYYDWLVKWTHEYLDVQFSAQMGYNLPVDMLANVPTVDAPETESLSFNNDVDGYRQYCGPANLAGKRAISIELGSDYLQPYTLTWTDLLRDAKRGFVAGVNQIIFHGAPYSHTYPNTTWPGFTSFSYAFAAHHSRHQPAWDVGYAEAVEYTARTQFILQKGIPKVDVVFWDKQTAQLAYPEPVYSPNDLSVAGYTYSYLSPDNFALEAARVVDGTLAPDAQAFRTLVIRGNDTLTVSGVKALATYARASLPIIVSGGTPETYNTQNVSQVAEAEEIFQSILDLPNVHQVPYEALASSISSIGVSPRTKVRANETWLTHWREDSNGDTYVFVYNDGNASTGEISFETTLRPIFLNAWTGEQVPVVVYSSDGKHTTIPLSLGSTGSALIKFCNESNGGYRHVVSAPANAVISPYSPSGSQPSVGIIASSDTNASVTLSDGVEIAIDSSVPETFTLTDWTLTIEQWLPPDDLFDVEITANKTNVTLSHLGPDLQAWGKLSTPLTNVSGVGIYSSSFHWQPLLNSSYALGAAIVLPPISHGATAILNGRDLPSLDLVDPVADISEYLVEGENKITIKVSSTLWNALRPIWGKLRTGTSTPLLTVESFEQLGYGAIQEYGIIGRVQVKPYLALLL